MAIPGVWVFHPARANVAKGEWYLKNKETSHLLLEFNCWLSRFRIPLLFFISGVVSYYRLQKRTAGGFIVLRFRRPFVPLLSGILVFAVTRLLFGMKPRQPAARQATPETKEPAPTLQSA
jgi:fucose 4-O-acetylase-like acetyltransferase